MVKISLRQRLCEFIAWNVIGWKCKHCGRRYRGKTPAKCLFGTLAAIQEDYRDAVISAHKAMNESDE